MFEVVLASHGSRYGYGVTAQPLDFATRLWFAWVCFFRVLLDAAFARRAWDARDETEPPANQLPVAAPEPLPQATPPAPVEAQPKAPLRAEGALMLLGILQREGRLVDFFEQDIAAFEDADVGAAARVVHEGCRKTLRSRFGFAPIMEQAEGKPVRIEADFDVRAIKLTGQVPADAAGLSGTLRHKGWRATKTELPEPTKGFDGTIVCQAEVEL